MSPSINLFSPDEEDVENQLMHIDDQLIRLDDDIENINEESLKVIDNAVLEKSLHLGASDLPYQFERTGYFKIDSKNSTPDKLVFNRAVSLRDSWARFNKKVG